MDSASFSVPAALLGQVVLFVLFILVVNALLREAARVVIRVVLVGGVLLAIAVVAGWLDRSLVGSLFETVGDWLIVGIRAVVLWLGRAWGAIAGSSNAP
jgi:hypothetical protein